jgi:hypothetical protein
MSWTAAWPAAWVKKGEGEGGYVSYLDAVPRCCVPVQSLLVATPPTATWPLLVV